MNISAAPVMPAPAAPSLAEGSLESDAAPAGFFESLLSGSTAPSGEKAGRENDPIEQGTDLAGEESAAEAEGPSGAEQIHLAALLFAMPVPQATPAMAVPTRLEEDGAPSSIGSRQTPTQGDASDSPNFLPAAEANLRESTAPAVIRERSVSAAPREERTPSATTVIDGSNPLLTRQSSTPSAAALPATAPMLNRPLARAENPTVPEGIIALPANPAKIAAMPIPGETVIETGSAKTSIMWEAAAPGESVPAPDFTSASPANADATLLPGSQATPKEGRGTAGAKAIRDMIDAPATQLERDSAATAVGRRPLAFSLPEEEAGEGQSQSFSDSPAAKRSELPEVQSGEVEPFSAPTHATAAPIARPFTSSRVEVAPIATPVSTASVIDEVGRGLERLQTRADGRVDLRVTLEGGGEVNIELQMRGGAVHTSFQTDSTELREALNQAWSQLASRSESLGMSLAEPVFKAPAGPSMQAGQQESGERRQEPPAEQNPTPSFSPAPQPKRSASAPPPIHPATSGLNLWA